MSQKWKDKAILAIEGNKQELLDLASKLIQFNTENPPGYSTAISSYISDYLASYEVDTKWHEPGKDMWNLLSEIGEENGKSLVYCGHTDVVPAGDPERWEFNPFSGEIRDGWLLGRGASDMKAGLAGLLFSMTILKRIKAPLNGKLQLVIVPDEETGGELGLPWLLERGLIKGDGALIAEPSSPFNPTIGQKGSLWFRLTVYGEQAHGCLGPLAGKNAITDCLKAIEAIQTVHDWEVITPPEVQPILDRTKQFMRGTERKKYMSILDMVSCNIGTIQGGTKSNVVPDSCTVEVDCRLPFGVDREEVQGYIKRKLDELNLVYKIEEFGFKSNANYTPAEDLVCQSIVNNISYVTNKSAYGVLQWASSDARHFREYGIPVLQYGPSYSPGIHNVNEKVLVEDIIRCAKVYAAAAIDYLMK